ncbi:MAG: metallophosphoesterase [Oscillospiraceae bacterium]|nr:metallophosphoesterase [Oscillospiraceae bacterium]
MALYTIGDLHLSLNSDKSMDVFGPGWADYVARIREGFAPLTEEDTTVLCGDLSWGMSLEESLEDLKFINALPGRKILLKGNHDYWWNTARKMENFFKENGLDSLEILHNNCRFYGDIALCGTRGWFYELDSEGTHNGKMMAREVGRLEASLQAAGEAEKLCFLHYPPLYTGYRCPEILALLQKYGVKRCFYGHLHGASHRRRIEGDCGGTDFALVAADYLGFKPLKICD